MHQILFPLGLHPRLRWGSLERFPRSIAVGLFKGAYASNGRAGLEREEGKGRKRGVDLPDQCQTASYAPAGDIYKLVPVVAFFPLLVSGTVLFC